MTATVLACFDKITYTKLDQSASSNPQYLRKLTRLVLGEDPAARSRRVEQFTAL